ncbi:MAG: hypothetical protein DSO09_03270 [Candidatus Methanomethylicota archaeon]|jgi:NitT/TauT family transport system substrate-binding protein|uniref:Solute-binding protein family 3/N-terminal domain-containing protein n=1 Tax=Thermoproteota archaeon TaxID=2056631 RepID=A0A520KE22_9CREN|nr:MAG: hypothetical protein EF809_05890 [Candidatus Verstraetearchaeota archaeon]TDA38879.1 MAG: hypothetical protein DSO09_03270 [Candidatus Verstraetearchaeota archaeon]
MKKIYFIIPIIIIALILISSFIPTIFPTHKKVKIGYMPAASYSLIWIAYEKGYFKEEGIEVELKEYPSVAQLVNALYNKEIDGAPLTSVAIGAFISKLDIKIVSGNSLDGTALVSTKKISKLEEISGMKLGTVQYVPGDFIFKKVITDKNITVDIKEYFSPPDALSALENGVVNASLLWEPYVSLAEYRNLTIGLWDLNVYNKTYPCCLMVFSDSYIKSNPDVITKFIRALIKAEVFAYKSPGEALPLVKKYLPGVPIEIIYKSIFYIDENIGKARNPVSAYIDYDFLKSFYSLLVPSLMSQNDYALLLSRIDLTYYQKAISSLRAEGFSLPEYYH